MFLFNDYIVFDSYEGKVIWFIFRVIILMMFDGNYVCIFNVIVYKGIIINYMCNLECRFCF